MDDISEFLLGPQRSSGAMSGILLATFAVVIAATLLGYFGWCYFRERQIRKRVRERVKRQCGGNMVPTQPVSCEAKRRCEESGKSAVRRRVRKMHPWKRRDRETPTPH